MKLNIWLDIPSKYMEDFYNIVLLWALTKKLVRFYRYVVVL